MELEIRRHVRIDDQWIETFVSIDGLVNVSELTAAAETLLAIIDGDPPTLPRRPPHPYRQIGPALLQFGPC